MFWSQGFTGMGSVLYISEDYNALTSIRASPTWSNTKYIYVPYLGILQVFHVFVNLLY